MSNIPTAEEFLKKLDEEKGTVWTEDDDEICIAFKEFAKLHVQAALEKASEVAEITDNGRFPYVDKKSILNSYPLENIK